LICEYEYEYDSTFKKERKQKTKQKAWGMEREGLLEPKKAFWSEVKWSDMTCTYVTSNQASPHVISLYIYISFAAFYITNNMLLVVIIVILICYLIFLSIGECKMHVLVLDIISHAVIVQSINDSFDMFKWEKREWMKSMAKTLKSNRDWLLSSIHLSSNLVESLSWIDAH
jgi:hypothetical protein